MGDRTFAAIFLLLLTGAVAADHYWGAPERTRRKERDYPQPLFVRYPELNEAQLMFLARRQARHTETRSGRLGAIEPGKKGLITLQRNQDMRVVEACIRALRERGADADYIFTDDLLARYGYPKSYAGRRGSADPITQPELHLVINGLEWYHFQREEFSEAAWAQLPPRSDEIIKEVKAANDAKVDALQKYLDSHPEYDYAFADFWGQPLLMQMQEALGTKFQFAWRLTTVENLLDEGTIPVELWRALEQKALEIIPWIRHAKITDPEGTDIEFSLTPQEAQDWRLGAFERDEIRMWPVSAARYLYLNRGLKRVVVPDANGVLASTTGHYNEILPRIVIQIGHGQAVSVEGGGLEGVLLNDIMRRYQDAHIPFLPRPGWAYIFHVNMGVNPRGGAQGLTWAFGNEILIPEIQEYGAKNHVPIRHNFHVSTLFPTYEVTVTGGRKIKILDRGHRFLNDDPEIRAIASKYGDPDDLLNEEGANPIPGINAPGDYAQYAKNPAPYWAKQREERKSGKSPYVVTNLPWQLQNLGQPRTDNGLQQASAGNVGKQ